MTAFLAKIFPNNATDPSTATNSLAPASLFSAGDRDIIKRYISDRECTNHKAFPPPCTVGLFFGFFFDGTNNNLDRDEGSHSHSNVARLYNAFPDNGKNGRRKKSAWSNPEQYYNFFRTYIPGVGTPFDEVGDTGEGMMRAKGLAFSSLGENRIIWALVEAINNVHKYYRDSPLIDAEQFKNKFNRLILPDFGDKNRRVPVNDWDTGPTAYQRMENVFTQALKELHSALEMYLPAGLPRKIKDKGVVEHIYLSLFGFSRGAAEARAFANWFVWLCQLDAKISGGTGLQLGTIPVTFDFMGLFDTVASVGLVASVPLPGAHGHDAWASSEHALKIPTPGPVACLHLVAGHEVRRSFPVDSVLFKGSLPSGCTEIVFPGVHSDIGGGYKPTEQGRGKDAEGADMLSRIALATMYRAARLAGVPLKLEAAPESVKGAFRIDPGVIEVFNAYIQSCAPSDASAQQVSGPLHEVMAQQHKLYIQWRKKMVGKMEHLDSFKASDSHEQLDITNADRELADEIRSFERWCNSEPSDDGRQQVPAYREWPVMQRYWNEPAPPSSVTDLFERFVHDSRAWFKPFGDDVPDLQFKMERLVAREEAIAEWQEHPYGDEPLPLRPSEKSNVAHYKRYRGTDNVRDGIAPVSEGREPLLSGAGFLRYRKIYMGSDRYKPAGAVYANLLPARDQNQSHVAAGEDRQQILAA